MINITLKSFRPPTGVNHYELEKSMILKLSEIGFRPPTGVNHYELVMI